MKRTSGSGRQENANNNYQQQIRNGMLSQYPTTILRSVCVSDILSVDHSVNKWLYERWVACNQEDTELDALHQDMASKICQNVDNPDLKITFVHLDPRTDKHPRASY